jgi:hypothetical protein
VTSSGFSSQSEGEFFGKVNDITRRTRLDGVRSSGENMKPAQAVDGSLILRQTLRGNVLATGFPAVPQKRGVIARPFLRVRL